MGRLGRAVWCETHGSDCEGGDWHSYILFLLYLCTYVSIPSLCMNVNVLS